MKKSSNKSFSQRFFSRFSKVIPLSQNNENRIGQSSNSVQRRTIENSNKKSINNTHSVNEDEEKDVIVNDSGDHTVKVAHNHSHPPTIMATNNSTQALEFIIEGDEHKGGDEIIPFASLKSVMAESTEECSLTSVDQLVAKSSQKAIYGEDMISTKSNVFASNKYELSATSTQTSENFVTNTVNSFNDNL